MSRITPENSHRSRLPQLPGLHFPSIIGRAWADRGPLLLAGVVVTIATLLAAAVPPLIRSTSDDALQQIVTAAGADGAVVVQAKFDPGAEDFEGSRIRPGNSSGQVDALTRTVTDALDPQLQAALRRPITTVTNRALQVYGHGPGRTFQLVYIAGADRARVTWTAGGPAKAVTTKRSAARPAFTPWPVQVGLSEQTAALLKVKPGDRIDTADAGQIPVEVRVSGIFRPVDAKAPEWQLVSQVLEPVVAADATGSRVEMSGLMSADSLPDGRLALDETDPTITATFTPEPSRLRSDSAEHLATAIRQLKAGAGTADDTSNEPELSWYSGLDKVLRKAIDQTAAAWAQASVLLVGLLTVAALVLLLAADLLVRRRANVLTNIRMRGASLAGIGAELVLESLAVALAGAALGLGLARAVTGDLSWSLPIPVVLVAVLGGPVFGTALAARATRGRQAPANRSARRIVAHTEQLRRLAMELAVVLAAAGAYVALRQRGVVPTDQGGGNGLTLPAFAPTLGAATGALVLLRLLPLAVNFALARAARSRRSLPLLAAARAAATAARPLPFLVLVMSSALLTFALGAAATETDGQTDAAWQVVGADAQLQTEPGPSVLAVAERMSTSKGVRQAVAARVQDNVQVTSDSTIGYVRLVAVDSKAYQQLLASTPLPDAPQLDRLTAAGTPLPALLRAADPAIRNGKQLTLRWDEKPITFASVGTAPSIGSEEDDVLIVDATAFAAAGADAAPNTVWAVGSGAATAATAIAAEPKTEIGVTLREKVEETRKSAPLAAGLLRLAYASTALLLLFGVLSVALGAAASSPARGETLARLRTLGLRSRESRKVAAGELLPPVAFGALGGLALGILLAHASLGLLALRLLTGQSTDPALVVPVLALVPVTLLILVVAVVVQVESSLHRRERLGQILRAGNS